jgi:hypothetical protein
VTYGGVILILVRIWVGLEINDIRSAVKKRVAFFASVEGLCAWEDSRDLVVVFDTRMRSRCCGARYSVTQPEVTTTSSFSTKIRKVALDHPKYALLNRSVFDSVGCASKWVDIRSILAQRRHGT